jgi:hypothetical protein
MRAQIDTPTETEQTTDNRPLRDAELNEVSGGIVWGAVYMNSPWYGGTGAPLWQPLQRELTFGAAFAHAGGHY